MSPPNVFSGQVGEKTAGGHRDLLDKFGGGYWAPDRISRTEILPQNEVRIDIEQEDRFLCGPFCLFKEKEIELGNNFVSLTCVPENGGYIHGGHKSRRIAALYNESDFPKDPEANKDTY